jgi:hypothetical protein
LRTRPEIAGGAHAAHHRITVGTDRAGDVILCEAVVETRSSRQE